ncbi:MAG: V-type ATP synthase subunit D [Candidatus Bathyarchaeia archaeon]
MSLRVRRKPRPTRYELLKLKDQLELARKAYDLLEEKYKVLVQEAQRIRRILRPFQKELKSKIEEAYAFLSEAIVSLGLRNVYRAALASKSNDDIAVRWVTMRSVSAPKLDCKIMKRTPLERGYGLAGTNYSLDKAAGAFENTTAFLVEVAELENILRILENEIENTGVRVSALEKILIPNLEDEIKMIENKLEEKGRERHVILKWIKERQPSPF